MSDRFAIAFAIGGLILLGLAAIYFSTAIWSVEDRRYMLVAGTVAFFGAVLFLFIARRNLPRGPQVAPAPALLLISVGLLGCLAVQFWGSKISYICLGILALIIAIVHFAERRRKPKA